MGGRDDHDASYDPRTWRSPDPIPSAHPAAGTGLPGEDAAAGSFDPRTWDSGTDEAEGPSPAGADGKRPGRRLGAWLAGIAGIALVAIAAAYFRNDPAPPPSPPRPPAAKAPAPARDTSRRTVMLADAAQVLPALSSAGVPPAAARRAAGQVLASLGDGPGEVRLDYRLAGTGAGIRLAALDATRQDGSGISLRARADGDFAATALAARLRTEIISAAGEMGVTDFYSAAVNSGISDSLVSDFANAFSFEFDFQREVSAGDVFEAAFEQEMNAAGAKVGQPRLLFASLQTATKTLRLYRFTPPGGSEPGWFDAGGRSNVRSLMRTPVDGARVSSRFGFRVHPIAGYTKLHRGTDFAAPAGTPVYASGRSVVEASGPRGGAGNAVTLRHENGWATKYFHLSRIDPGIVAGESVAQGQEIGLVGSTGNSTGPHLHYEVWIDGEPVDSLTIPTGTGVTLQGAALAAFRKEQDRIDRGRAARLQ
jgi:murein DD-endopeptidase MepM/ murein hydrolase activator NlpD